MQMERFCEAILDQVKHREPRTKHGEVYVVAHASIRRHRVFACRTHRHLCVHGFFYRHERLRIDKRLCRWFPTNNGSVHVGGVHPVRPSPSVRPTTSQKDLWTTRLLFGSVASFDPRPCAWVSSLRFGVLANVCTPSSEPTLPSPSHPTPPL